MVELVDLRGRQYAVVDANLIDGAVEKVRIPAATGADKKGARVLIYGRWDTSADGQRLLLAVHVDCGARGCGGDVVPYCLLQYNPEDKLRLNRGSS